ncbi:hypothetical protein BASA83_001092 [Batrachochytrium salamandrivorans]|nr:hypothetical protein BASA81_012192 [Batrachochytrium salamandrivorans]KAH9276399.1 hypothetical protein BASA83_001092 [Batrachochytrium salamandrivorans]
MQLLPVSQVLYHILAMYWLTPQVRPKTVKQRHSFALMKTLRTCGDSASLQKYVTRQLLDTSGFFKDSSVSDGRTDLVFSAARAMSGNSSRSAAVTPLYNSDGIVQYDPTSILRVMQGHYGSLAKNTTECRH